MSITCCPICDMRGEISPLTISTESGKIVCQDGHNFSSVEDVNKAAERRNEQILQRMEHSLLRLFTEYSRIVYEKGWSYINPSVFLETIKLVIEIQKMGKNVS